MWECGWGRVRTVSSAAGVCSSASEIERGHEAVRILCDT